MLETPDVRESLKKCARQSEISRDKKCHKNVFDSLEDKLVVRREELIVVYVLTRPLLGRRLEPDSRHLQLDCTRTDRLRVQLIERLPRRGVVRSPAHTPLR